MTEPGPSQTPLPTASLPKVKLQEPQILKQNLFGFSLWLMITSLIIILLSLIVAGIAFSTYIGGGRSWMGIAQSFALCFGLASVIYIPALLQFFMARRVRTYGPNWLIGLTSIVLSVPFWSYSGAALYADYPYKLWLFGLLSFGLAMLIWGICNIVQR